MNKQLWQKAQMIFEQSLTLVKSARSEFIVTHTTDQDELRQLVEAMLLAEQDETFMHSMPSVEVSEVLNNEAIQIFGHFTIIQKIAVGGMGRIFKARSNHSEVAVYVALKLIRRELLSEQMLLRFDNEKAILGKLKHHHIAALIDAGVVDETPYIATEWIEGQSINEYVLINKLNVNQSLNLFLQACEAVAYAHTQLVIHRDLKPANILIDSNKQVKLLDFGIAKLIDHPDGQMTQTQVFTPDYAAPEQINGEACTTATDIYALGVLLFELLVGEKRFGFEELSMAEKVKAIAQPKTVFASQVMQRNKSPYVQKVKGALDTIINQAMHADPNRRYPAVYELINDIKRFQQHLPIQAMGDGWAYRSQMFFSRNPWSSILGMMLLISLSTGLIYTNHQKAQAIKAQMLAQSEAEKSQQMLNFFMTTLESASPISGGSTQISVQEMFVQGSKKIDLETIHDEAIRALIAGQIAEIFGELLEYDLAIAYNKKALEYYSQNIEQHASKFLYHNMKITGTYQYRNLFELALEHLSKVYEQVKQFPLEPNVHAEAMILLGLYHNNLNHPKKALEYYQKGEYFAKQVNDVESLGKVKFYQYRILQDELPEQESEQYLQQAQKYFEQAYPEGHPDLLAVRNTLALGYSEQGDFIKANKMYQILHTESIQLYGYKDHDHLTNHAGILLFLGQFSQAYALVSESLKIIESQGVEAGFNSMAARIVQARSLTELGRFDEATTGLQGAADFFRTRFAPDHFVTMILRSYKLDLLIKSGQESVNPDEEAELMQLADKQLNESIRSQGRYARTALIVATSYWKKGQRKQALDHLEMAKPAFQIISKKQDWLYWLIQAGAEQLRSELDIEFDKLKLNTAKHELFMLLPENHWYHGFFVE